MAALEILGSAAASASSLPTPVGAPASRVSVVGDSLTIGTMRYQGEAFTAVGWGQSTIDAYKSRGIRTKIKTDKHTGLTSVDGIRATVGEPELWVIALGTNDAGLYSAAKQAEVIGLMMDKIGTGHEALWVNIYLPKTPDRQDHWNATLADAVKERGDGMSVLDWASLAGTNPLWLANDHIHCTGKGYQARAMVIADVTRNFARVTPTSATSCAPAGKGMPA